MADDATTLDTPETPETQEKPEQTVKIEDVGPARKKLTIELPESRIAAALEDSFGKLADDAVVPGFRRGRVPQRLIQKRFGQAVRDDVRGTLISEAYTQAIEDNDIRVLGEPDVKDADKIEMPDKGSMTFEVEIEVTPEVELPDLEGLTVEKVAMDVSDSDVDDEVGKFQERFGNPEETNEGIQADDYVDTHMHAKADETDEEFAHGNATIWVPGKSRDYKGHVGGIVVNDLGKQLEGKAVGDKVVINTTGPESHENEAIRGKPITISLRIDRVQRVKPAEIETVCQNFGVENEEELRKQIREMIEGRAEREQTSSMHEQVIEQLMDKVDMTLPTGLSGRQTERILNRRKMELLYQGASEEEVEQKVAEMRDESEEESAKMLKQFFILDAVSNQLEVEVQEQELNGRIAAMAYQQGRRPEKLRQEMHRSGELENLFMQMREQKTLDAIIEKATIKEVKESSKPKEDKDAKASEKKSSKKKSSKKKSSKKKKAD